MHATIRPYEGMVKFLRWRKMTWALLLWGAAMGVWLLLDNGGVASVALLWIAGSIVLGLLWIATQPLFRQGHGLRGFFVRPGPGQWRVTNLHRSYWTADYRGDTTKGNAS